MARPAVTLKLATSLDGKIALANGLSEWITCEKSRAEGRKLRGVHDAIIIGSNTAVLDNPQLTTRISGQPNPVRIVFDTHLRLSQKSNLALTAQETPVWIFTKEASGEAGEKLSALGVRLINMAVPSAAKSMADTDAGIDVTAALQILYESGIKSVLVEGGGTLAASFIRLGVIDVIEWFRAPIILGGDGRSAIGALGLQTLNLAHEFSRIHITALGSDMHERYERRP